MSRGISANKPNVFSEVNEELYEYIADEISDPFFSEIEYAEWNDAELNAETWDQGKVKQSSSSLNFFEDSSHTTLPPAIKDAVESWQRPHEVFTEANLTVYDPSNEDFSLRISSPVARCYMFQSFIENLTTLQYLALRYGFPVELETPLFASNTQGEPWRPWHHIYGMCRAGKGTVHKPVYCPYGKYVLRLFYMGSWRRFVVDDRIPCDKAGNCILPVTQVPGELWPIILMKGLFKIFQFWVSDLPILTVFTGWTMCSIMTGNKTYEEVWRRLILLTRKHETLEKEDGDKTIEGVPKKETTRKNSIKDSDEAREEKFCFVIANLKFSEGRIKKSMVVTMNRDSPLVKANKRESTKPWKKIRWVYWALKKGLWMDESKLPPYRRIYCINFEKEVDRILLPDPKLESVFFDIESNENENTPFEDDEAVENEEWYDYNKFYEYLFSLNVYFKPNMFTSNVKISSLIPTKPPISGKRVGSTAEVKTSVKPFSSPNTFVFSPFILRNVNEPPLLFCESTTGIFICITLSVWSSGVKNNCLNLNDVEYLKFGLGSLVIERFDWRKLEQGEIVGATKTMGYSSIELCLKPGRHVFKLWIVSEVPYVITVNSNVEVVIHRGPKIRFLLKNEAERIICYINNVSNAFIALTQKFGKPDLPESLKEFYSIIKPGNDSVPEYFKKMDEFIETFLNCILLCLKNAITNTEEVKIMMQALQSLFFNPGIYCELPRSPFPVNSNKKSSKKYEPVIQENNIYEDYSLILSPDEIAQVILIQKVFRGYRVRLLWKWQMPARKEFKPFAERLKKICDTIFAPSKREIEVGKLIRRILFVKPKLLTTFKFHDDFQNTIDVQEFTGKMINVEPFAWVPIARFLIVCNSDIPIPCAFYLSCNLEQFVIQGVDNDTTKEVFRLTNCLTPHYYLRNSKGYTIFVYGWNEAKMKTVNWRLQMVRMKYFDMLCLCNTAMSQCNPSSLPAIEVFEIKNFYVPNQRGRICRCLIKIHKRTLLSLRFSTSSPDVVFEIIISQDSKVSSSESKSRSSKETLTKVRSLTGAALISGVFLEHFENSDCEESDVGCTVYVLEVYVLNNSWPLTKHEWGVIEPFRVNGEAGRESLESLQFRKGGSESKRKLSRISRRTLSETRAVESPYWMLQFIIESHGGDPSAQQVVIEEDKSFTEYVKDMKLQWEEKDPGRRSRGNDLRKNFLYMVWLEKRNVVGEGEGEFEISKGEEDEIFSDFNLLIRRMSSFSYLLEDTGQEKYIKSPRILPQMPTQELLLKYKKPNFPVPEAFSESGSSDMPYSDFELTSNMIEDTEEHLPDFLTQCMRYREVMANYANDEQKQSNQLMEEAYEGRIKAIRQLPKAAV